MEIKEKSPTRVDLAGGTLDCWPLYTFIPGSMTINLSIDIYTGVYLKTLNESIISVEIDNFKYKKEFKNFSEFTNCTDKELHLLQAHVKYWKPEKGFYIKTYSESPVGGGLGGSSSLSISLIKAFSRWFNKPISLTEMVQLASNIEAGFLHTPTGTQDYFPAADPGLNIIDYGLQGPRHHKIDFPVELFSQKMFLVDTGQAHHSGINNWQVLKAAVEKDSHTLECLTKIAEVARELRVTCETQSWSELPKLFQKEYKYRSELSPYFASPEIQKLEQLVLQTGGEAVKICGAGGGGCVLVWSSETNKEKVIEVCQNSGFHVLAAKPVLVV